MTTENVPGLEQLRGARNRWLYERDRWDGEFSAMMEDEYNDGVRPPAPVNKSLKDQYHELQAQYPRAKVYLQAESYTESSNYHKSAAGDAAMEMLESGCELGVAENVLDNWLPTSAHYD